MFSSVEFLRQFHPEGYWVLTAIAVSGQGIETETFTASEEEAAAKWVGERSGQQNLYFSVNQPNRPLGKKARMEDIHAVGWLHVDIDARVGEPLDDELRRIKKLLTEDCPVPKPTFIVFSGGGYQAFWKLEEAQDTKGRTDIAEDLARYNKQLEVVLGGDACSNVDRIMRLPGTLNIPTAKKVEKGRREALAQVIEFNEDAVYSLGEFTQAPKVQVDGTSSVQNVRVNTGNIPRLSEVHDLDKWKVPDRVKVVIVQGEDVDNPKEGDNSRSAWLFDVCCQLLRCGVPDEIIYSVITDPDFLISASVLDKTPRIEEYALHQIRRAKEEVEAPTLREFNDRFFVVGNLGGKCRVIEEVYDQTVGRTIMTRQTFTDFRYRYSNQYVQVGKKSVSAASWWLAQPNRRQFDYIIFSPGREVPGAYNLWQGFSVNSIPGNKHEPYLEHLLQNVCRGNHAHYDYLIGWMARCVQFPDRPGMTAVVLRGKSGTGKSFFAKMFGALWGRHFLQVSDAKHLVGSFNYHLRDCVVLFGDEAFYAGDKKHESVLKTLITEEQMIVEQKGVDAEVSSNFIHLIMASNEDWVVPTGPTERRFFVLDVGDAHRQDNRYFRAIREQMEAGGFQSLLHFLMKYNLGNFDVRKVPMTSALMDQKVHSMSPMEEWWFTRLMDGALMKRHEGYFSTVPVEDLHEDYVEYCKQYNINRIGNRTKLGLFLGKVCPGNFPIRERQTAGTARQYAYEFPALRHLREKYNELFNEQFHWPEEAEETADSSEVPF